MKTESSPVPRLKAIVGEGNSRKEFEFTKGFTIGRAEECEVCIPDEHVSRFHAEVILDNHAWWIRDLNSTNGLYVLGRQFNQVTIAGQMTLRLGVDGPEVSLRVAEQAKEETNSSSSSDEVVARYMEHYFDDSVASGPAGEHTMFVRKAFSKIQSRQKIKYGYAFGALFLCLIGAGTYAFHEHQQAQKQREMAESLFYAMKSLDIDIANLENAVLSSNNQQGTETIKEYQKRHSSMEESYNQFLATLHVYNPKMTEQEKLIMRVTRIFGECELDMPPDYMTEVSRYIKMWQGSGRFVRAVKLARKNGYTPLISQELLAQSLPPQYFYLALQESDFDPYASGPLTRKGIAKGMWQFIPDTAVKYGLRLGPLVDLRRPDPSDDRHHYDKESKAAAQYIKDLYSTDAQASGLLVMACYNWGEGRVLPLVRSMPLNPRERNFWQLLAKHRDQVPQETYDYVFYIVSAAVIGENPRLFGFDLDNPLAEAHGESPAQLLRQKLVKDAPDYSQSKHL